MDGGLFSDLFDAGMPYLSPFQTGIIVMVLLLLFIALLSTAGYFPVLLSITSYTPVVSRIKARGVPYIEYERVMELLESGSLQDCISRLKNTGYLKEISSEYRSEQVEEELLTSWYKEVVLLRSESPRDAWNFFDGYLLFQESEKVKRIIRLVHQQRVTPIAEDPSLWPDGFSPELAAKIASTQTVSECVRFLQETRYGGPLMTALPEYEKEHTLFFLENALDCMGYTELFRQSSMVINTMASPFRDFFSVLADIQNVRTLLRAKHTGRDPREVSLCLVPGGSEIPSWRLVQLNEMMSVPDIVRQLSGTRFDPALSPHIRNYPSPDGMLLFDMALDRLKLDSLSRLSLDYYHAGGPVLWYLVAKEYELRNIRIILSGLDEGIKPELITRMLVLTEDNR